MGANSSLGFTQAVIGNKWLLGQGFQHAIGASSTEAQMYRAQSLSIATTGNPANALTGIASDAIYSRDSDGVTSVLTQPGNHVVSASMSVNDRGGSSATFYDTAQVAPHPNAMSVHTLENIGTYADNLGAVGKALIIGNEFPRGRIGYQMESHAVSGGTCTASHVSGFIDGEIYGAPGVIAQGAVGLPKRLTKVTSAPIQDQYTVSAGGVYTFGGVAPTTAWLTYTAQGGVTTAAQLRIVNGFYNSSSASYVDPVNGTDYKMPGLKTRTNVIIADTWNALVDPASGATQLALPGTMDTLELHHNQLGALKAAKAFKTAFDAAYPSAASMETRPTRNNWWAARGTGAGTTFTGTLPPTMRTGFTVTAAPTLISINGVPIGKVDTGTGAITGTGITAGTLNFATGVWAITFDLATRMPANAQLWFEQDIGNYDLTAMAEGTIGRNVLMNGLLDLTAAVGTNLATTTGASTISTITAAQVPYGWSLAGAALQTAITNGTATATASSGTSGDGYPYWAVDIEGSHTAAWSLVLTNLANSPGGRLTAGDKFMGGARIAYANHSTNGALYGTSGIENKVSIGTASVSRPSSSGPQNVTIIAVRNVAGTLGATANLFNDSSLIAEWGGALDLYKVTPLADTTGCTFGTTQHNLTIGGAANIPAAGRFVVGQLQFRRRNDVAI
jgi:hypothetical protein